jgi:hypothetical protein
MSSVRTAPAGFLTPSCSVLKLPLISEMQAKTHSRFCNGKADTKDIK